MMCESQVVPRICDTAHTMEALKVRSKDIHAAVVEELVNRYHQEVHTLQSVTKEGYVQEDGNDIKEETTDKCMSVVIKEIDAPVGTVWSVVRRFDMPQAYKRFARTCRLTSRENGAQTSNKEGSCCLNEHGVYDKEGICCPIEVGCVREVEVVSGLPATWSRERLEVLDDENHVLAISIIGGHHRLRNYRSVTTLHSIFNSQHKEKTLAVESYVVDVPEGNTVEDTKVFIDTIVRCNLQSLADVSKRLHQQQ